MTIDEFNKAQLEHVFNLMQISNCQKWHFLIDPDRVDNEFVKSLARHLPDVGKVVLLNMSPSAVSGLTISEDVVHCGMRFKGKPVHLSIPVNSIFAYELEDLEGNQVTLPVMMLQYRSAVGPKGEKGDPRDMSNVVKVNFGKNKGGVK